MLADVSQSLGTDYYLIDELLTDEEREILTDLLRRQVEATPPKDSRGFWRRLFGR